MYPTKEELKRELKKYYNHKDKGELRSQISRIEKGKIVFFYKKVDDFNFWVKDYYAKNAERIEIVKNILKDDNTINYKVTYSIDKLDDIFNTYILNNYNNYLAVKDYPLNEVLDIASEGFFYKSYKIHNLDMSEHKKIFQELMETLKLSKEKTIKKLYNKYVKENEQQNLLTDIVCFYYRMNYFDDPMQSVQIAYNKKDEIIREILGLSPNVKLNNTSELTLFKIVKDIYNDAIYQYKAEWLGKQSIDIYIPSRRLAIEYQGEQHYNPVDIFGGEKALIHQKELDNRKRKLCIENKIRLIEWKYDKKITEMNLKDILKTLT